ncbi:MAG: hypothetical protein NHF95_00445 [Candidatus Shikimatogenerans sp. JK-2022]|nr:hypothetical protein [Candidatus Shikimatogenerans bostrichidophilus]
MINIKLIINYFLKKKINITKKKILKFFKKRILKIFKKIYYNFNLIIELSNDYIFFKKKFLIVKKVKNKKKEISINKLKNKNKCYLGKYIKKNINLNKLKNSLILKIKKELNKFINKKLLYKYYLYYSNKINKLILLKLININKNILILNDKYNYLFFYKVNKNYINKFFLGKNYYFLITNVFFLKKKKKIKIIISRNNNIFIIKILKLVIPEIKNNIIKIKDIARIQYIKIKIIIYTKNKNINLIGTCIGIKCIRKNILNKILNNEKIEFIKYNKNFNCYLNNLFFPLKIEKKIILKNKIIIFFKKKFISRIIGKNGNNIKLISLLLKTNIIINEYNK